jgi:hypothetical protein
MCRLEFFIPSQARSMRHASHCLPQTGTPWGRRPAGAGRGARLFRASSRHGRTVSDFACAGIRSRANNGRDLNQMFRDLSRDTEYIVSLITTWVTSATFLVATVTQSVILVGPPRCTGRFPHNGDSGHGHRGGGPLQRRRTEAAGMPN